MARADPSSRPVPDRQRPHPLGRAQPARSSPGWPAAAPTPTSWRAISRSSRPSPTPRSRSATASACSRTGRAPTRRCSTPSPRRATSINMETYILDGRRGWRALRRLRCSPSRRKGVQVNLIHDAVGTLGDDEGILRAAQARAASASSSSTRSTRSRPRPAGTSTSATTASSSSSTAGARCWAASTSAASTRAAAAPRVELQRLARRRARQGGRQQVAALARHRPAHRRAGGRVAAEALLRDLGRARRAAARGARLLPGR